MPKAILANHMLHAAGLLFGGFGLYTGFHQQASEEAMFLVGLLRYFAAYIGQAEEEILIHGEEATRLQGSYRMAHAGL